jgi:hypothetical protein
MRTSGSQLHTKAKAGYGPDTSAADDGFVGSTDRSKPKENQMKTLLALLVASATLAGCVAVPYDSGPPPRYQGQGDRDRDGVPNRYDRDRDNDGVPNRHDSRPNNPNRY